DLWGWIGRVAPDDGVIAHYAMTAPLSSRRRLFSYVMTVNRPEGYPDLPPDITWAFCRKGDLAMLGLPGQGFRLVHDGLFARVFRRDPPATPAGVVGLTGTRDQS